MLDYFVGAPGNGARRRVADDPWGETLEKTFEKAVLTENHLRGRKNVFVFNLRFRAVRFLYSAKRILRGEFRFVW